METKERASTGDLAKFAEENRQLRRRLNYLTASQTQLEQRVERIENSVVFRTLRWLGRTFLKIYSRFYRGGQAGMDLEYTAWTEQPHPAPVPEGADARSILFKRDPGSRLARITLLVEAPEPDRLRFERTLSSLLEQTCPDWEAHVCTAAPAPAWLDDLVKAEHDRGVRIGVVSGEDICGSLTVALRQVRSEYVALVRPDSILDPCAVQCWLAHLECSATAVYSDWDHVDSKGRRHTPRFTPEFSPELLLQTLYWGGCYAAETETVRETGWPTGCSLTSLEHDLGLRLAERPGAVTRIPQMLWHLQEAVENAKLIHSRPHLNQRSSLNERASIIVCSRNAGRLETCLKSLKSTIDPRHEVTVVAHHMAADSELDQVAQRHGAASIPYRGVFHFGEMNELGAAPSHGSVLFFVNDDVRPLGPGWIEFMIAQAMRPDVGVVGALLFYPSGEIQHAGIVVGKNQLPVHVGRFERESRYWPWLGMTREVTAVTGACLAVRREVWDQLGGFDRRFPVNYNDVDFCLRARQKGYRVLMEAKAALIHEESQTRIPVVRLDERELFCELWGTVLESPDAFFNPQLVLTHEAIRLPEPWPLLRSS